VAVFEFPWDSKTGPFCIFRGVEFFIALQRSAEKGPVLVEVILRVGFRIVRIVKINSPPDVKNLARFERCRIVSENRFWLAMQRAFCSQPAGEGMKVAAEDSEATEGSAIRRVC
jgi:hypothetical protein